MTNEIKLAKQKDISWDVSKFEVTMIVKCCERYEEISNALNQNEHYDRQRLIMDLTACHANGCELNFDFLLNKFDDFNFIHDIIGISNHIDRTTGQLQDCFLPRCAIN